MLNVDALAMVAGGAVRTADAGGILLWPSVFYGACCVVTLYCIVRSGKLDPGMLVGLAVPLLAILVFGFVALNIKGRGIEQLLRTLLDLVAASLLVPPAVAAAYALLLARTTRMSQWDEGLRFGVSLMSIPLRSGITLKFYERCEYLPRIVHRINLGLFLLDVIDSGAIQLTSPPEGFSAVPKGDAAREGDLVLDGSDGSWSAVRASQLESSSEQFLGLARRVRS